jgi:hypothetical protein
VDPPRDLPGGGRRPPRGHRLDGRDLARGERARDEALRAGP